uniref:Cullin family profile domain-containing protein n=2 Tax=Plectus sambesii TaxID=2011161 RepID=A0A914W5Q5_9BILA
MANLSSICDTQLSLEDIWKDLEQGLIQIYTQQGRIELNREIAVRRRVYEYCITDDIRAADRDRTGTGSTADVKTGASELYDKLGDFFKALVLDVLKEGKDLNGEDLLKFYELQRFNFKIGSMFINRRCDMLNRTYIKSERDKCKSNIYYISELALIIWKQHLVKEMHKNLTSAVLKMIERQRLGEAIKASLIWSVLESYVEFDEIEVDSRSQVQSESHVHKLLSFRENFEKLFLKDTQAFYTKEAVDFIANNPVAEYMRKVEHWLKEEQHRYERYLHPSTQEGLVKTCEKVLIANQLDLFQNEFRNLLVDGLDEDLARVYSLCNRVDGGLVELKAALKDHIEEHFTSAAGECDERDAKIGIILLLRRYNTLVERYFLKDPGFVRILDKTWAALVNEPLAHLFIDELRELKPTLEGNAGMCEKVLIARNIDIIKDDFRTLLVNGRNEALSRMYSRIHPVDDDNLSALINILEKHIEEEGMSAIDKCGEENLEIYVHTILEVHRRYSILVEHSFHNESCFVQALDKACAAFINKNSLTIVSKSASKSPGLLARYCDWLLKKSAKNPEEAELEDSLTQAMIVFKYIEDKDIFEKFYSKMFAKRLVSSLLVNDDAESTMIGKLKQMCGCDYTSKLQRMLTDTHSSKELNEAFKEHERNASTSLNLDFSIAVFNSGVWPSRQTFTFEIPSEFVSCIGRFTDFYNHRHNGRKLTWLLPMSKGELTTNCFQKKYTFTASTVQMALLLMFNESVEYTIGMLVENLKLKKEVLVQVVQALVKIQLLKLVGGDFVRKSPSTESSSSIDKDFNGETPDLPDGTIIRLNTSFSNKKLKTDLSKMVLRTEVRQEQEQIHKNIEEDRKMVIQAAIVRIMKMRKQLKHQQLVSEVLQQLSSRFQPKVPVIKKCIELLIEKEYLRRVEDENDVYKYLV